MRTTVLVLGLLALVGCSDGEGGGSEAAPQAVVDVGTATHVPYNLSTASGRDVVAVAWNDYDEEAATEAPVVVTSTDGGKTFGPPVAVDADDPYVAYPQLAVTSSGDLLVGVTLYGKDETDGRAGLYRSTDSGASFQRLADLTAAPRVAFTATGTSVAVTPDGSTVVMAWTTPGDGDTPGALVGVVSTDGGATFGEPRSLAAQAGAARPRAFAGEDGSGVVAVESVPLADPPAPTPAAPNPVTATPQVMLFPVEGSGFGEGRPLTTDAVTVIDEGPGAASADNTVAAWWEAAPSGVQLRSAIVGSDGPATDVLPAPLRAAAPVEVATGADGPWFLTVEPEGDASEPAPLVLARRTGDGAYGAVAVAPLFSRSAEEYDLTTLDGGGVLVVWFDQGTIRAQRVTT